MTKLILPLLLLLIASSCAVKKTKNLEYLDTPLSVVSTDPTLNVFTPRKKNNEKLPVLIYIHGGNWNSGSKELYGFFGRNFAKKNVITVIPGYTLSPEANYNQMATQIAQAILWTQENIANFNGDPDKIYITGHSAGGHLAALATLNPKYNIAAQTIKGIILNDAAGLDMHHYLSSHPPTQENNYITTWTTHPSKWQDASPINFLNNDSPPFMIYNGSKTYKSIEIANQRFLQELHVYQPNVKRIILPKKHVPMILQYFWPWNNRFNEIANFINK